MYLPTKNIKTLRQSGIRWLIIWLEKNVLQNSASEWLGKWLQEWLGHTGSYDLFQQAARRGWPVTKALAKQTVDSCHFCQIMVQYMSKGQQFVNIREGKLLWETWQVDCIDPLKQTPEGWKQEYK